MTTPAQGHGPAVSPDVSARSTPNRPHATARQLRCFVALVEEGGFTRAAKRIGISQPTLSEQVRALERAIGGKLVERGTALVLTPRGRSVLEGSRDVLLALRKLDEVHGDVGLVETVRLGACPTIGPYLLPALISEFHRDHPALRLHVREDTPGALSRGLVVGEYDLLLVPVEALASGFEIEPIIDERLYVATAADRPVGTVAEVDFASLAGQTLLAVPSGHGMEACVMALAADGGLTVSRDVEGTSLHAIRQMAAMDMGLALLPELYVRRGIRGVTDVAVRPVGNPSRRRRIGLAWRRGTTRTPLDRAITDRVRVIATSI